MLEETLISPFSIINIELLGNIFRNIDEFSPSFNLLVVGIVLLVFFKWINPLIRKFIAYFARGAIQISLNGQRKIESAKNQKIYEANSLKSHNQQVQRIKDIERAKAEGQAEAMLKMYKGQLSLLQDHKKRGMDIEKETFDLRKKLLKLESDENEKMINDLLKTLDRL